MIRGEPSDAALDALLSELEGDARSFADKHRTELLSLPRDDRELWAELAAFLAVQRLRDRRDIMGTALGAVIRAAEEPQLRETVHDSLRRLTRRSARLTAAYSGLVLNLAGRVPDESFREIDLRVNDLSGDVDLAAAFMDYAPAVLARRDMDFLRAWHAGAVGLAKVEWWASRGFLQSVGKAAHWLKIEDLPVLAELGTKVASRSRHAVKGLYSALPALMASMRTPQLVEWVELGLEVTRGEEDLVLYMSYGSKRSQEAVELLAKETSFSAFRGKVALLLEAFLGRPAIIHSMYEVLDPATIPPDVPAFSDGLHLYVRPALSVVGRSPYSLYKLVALHAVAHERFGSFEDQGLAALLRERPMGGADEVSEYDRFFVGLAEDVRIDAALFHTLPGLRRDALTILEETYADFRADGPLGGVPLTPDSLRAHLAGAPFGVRLLADGEVSRVVEDLVAPLTRPGVTAAESTAVGEALHRYLGPRLMAEAESWGDTTSRTAADVPYPPYHDHFFLGLKLSTVAPAEEGTLPLGSLIPGTGIDLPGSLHPSELIAGLEITVRDKQQEADLLILDEEEEEDEDDSNFSVFGYDEWDHELGDYRSRWCTVRCRDLPPGDPKFVPETVARYKGEVLLIRRQFERLRPDRIKKYFKQEQGDELDLDALTEALVDRLAGAPMSDKVFIRRDKKQRDVACVFLLDMSDSTDQLVEDDRRVIDVEKEGLVLLAEAIGQLDDQYAIMGFSSRGRKMVDLYVIKGFEEDFDDVVSARIGGIQPLDYTRLGAAIRHAVGQVAVRPAAARLVVLLSDGRPYDMGYGDMRYATEDTKMALHEARRAGVNSFCITVDPEGPDYLEDLFGANGYTVIQHVSHLPTKLPRIYRNLTV